MMTTTTTSTMDVSNRAVREAEEVAEKVALNYMGQIPSDEVVNDLQREFKEELDKAGLGHDLINIYLDQSTGSIFIFQPVDAPSAPRQSDA